MCFIYHFTRRLSQGLNVLSSQRRTMASKSRAEVTPPRSAPSPASIESLSRAAKKYLTPEDIRRMSNPLQSIAEQSIVKYDRYVNIKTWGGREPDPGREFLQALPPVLINKKKPQPKNMVFFKVHSGIRRKIYSYVFELPASGKKVTLSIPSATKEVYPLDFFITPWELLHQIQGGLVACHQMRDELLTYFWNTYHFHVTFSPFTVGPVFSGLSIKWLNMYAERVNHLTVEVDMTKLEFSVCKNARLLKKSNEKVHKVLCNLVTALARKKNKNVMAHLTLLVRRYMGFRLAPADNPEDKEVLYCPEEALAIFNPFRDLRGIVLQCSMSGFSVKYSRDSMKGMFMNPMTRQRAIIFNQWPDYTPPSREVTYHSSFNTNDSAETPPFGTSLSVGKGQSTASVGSSIFGYALKTPSVGSSASAFGYAQNMPSVISSNSSSFTPAGSFASSSRAMPSSRVTPNAGLSMVDDSGVPIDSNGNRIGLGISIVPEATSFAEEVESEIARRGVQQLQNGSDSARSPSPNTMNTINEQDPAFKRALEGLKLASDNGDVDEESVPAKQKKKHGNKKGKKRGKKH